MSAITYDWMPFETETKTEAPTNHSIKPNKMYSREEEFRSALDSYMADYREHHAMIATGPKRKWPLALRLQRGAATATSSQVITTSKGA